MKDNKNTKRFLAAAVALITALSAAGCSGDKNSASNTADSGSKSSSDSKDTDMSISADDKDVGYDESSAVSIALSGTDAEISGSGAECKDGVLSITEEGVYLLSGDFSGQIYIKSKGSNIRLVLCGVNVTSSDGAALLVDKASKVTLTLKEDTENSFSDPAEYSDDESDDSIDAAIFARSDLTINGDGALTVNGSYKHAVVSKDNLVVTGGTLTVTAQSGGLYGKDSVKIGGGTINVTAGSNGIRATNSDDATKGYVYIAGGDITVTATGDGIEAETAMQIDDGTVNITTGGGSSNASVVGGEKNDDWGTWKNDGFGGGNMGMQNGGGMAKPDDNGAQGASTSTDSGTADSTTDSSTDSATDSSADTSQADASAQQPQMPQGGDMSMPDGEMPQGGGDMAKPDGEAPQGGDMAQPDQNAAQDSTSSTDSSTADSGTTDSSSADTSQADASAQQPQMPQGGDMSMPDGEMPQGGGDMAKPDGEAPQGGDMAQPDQNAAQDSTSSADSSTTDSATDSSATDSGTAAQTTTSSDSSSDSAKGLKAGSSIVINGGTFNIDSSDDSIHSNGTADIGGSAVITANSGDDGIHADETLTIAGGTVDIQKSYEGLEGVNVVISDGDISVVSSDDGINAAGGSDTGMEDRAGRDGFGQNSGNDYLIDISGGTIKINALGDGIDSNGSLAVSGGEIYVSGPTNGGNGAIDVGEGNSTATITGGIIVAAGAQGMEVGFDDTSTQYNVLHNLSSTVSGGTEFTVTDSDGNVVISCTPENSYQSVVFSCPDLADGTYTITAGDLTETVEISSVCTSNSTSFGMGGGGFGGGQGGGNDGDNGGVQGETNSNAAAESTESVESEADSQVNA